MAGFLVVCAVCAFTATARRAGGLAHRAGGAGLRRDGRLPAGGGRQGPGPAAAARVRRGVARGGRQPAPAPCAPACRCPRRSAALSERGPEPLRESFAGFALDYQVSGRFGDSLDRLKDRLADPVGDRVVESLRVAREVGGGDLGRLLRSLSGLPARRRPHPRRAPVAPGVDGQRRPARRGRAVAGAAADVLPARGDPALLDRRRRRRPGRRRGAVRPRLPADGAHRPAARPSGGSCRDPAGGCPARCRARARCLARGDRGRSTRGVRRSRCGCCPTSATCRARTPCPRPVVLVQRVRRRLRPVARRRPAGPSSGCSAAAASVRRRLQRAGLEMDVAAVPGRAGRLGAGRVRGRRRARRVWSRPRRRSARCRC